MNAHNAVLVNLDITRKLKEQMVQDAGGPDDLMPVLLIEWEDGQHALVALPEGRDMVVPAVRQLRADREGTIASLTFCADALIREYDPENDPDAPKSPDDVQKGDLERGRAEGDMRVQDVLIVTAVDVKGELASTMQRYGYGDRGELVWGESVDLAAAGQVDGAVPDVLREAIQ